MTRLIRDIRIIPVVVFAAASLLALKIIGIGFDGGYVLGSAEPASGGQKVAAVQTTAATPSPPAKSWAQEMFGFAKFSESVIDIAEIKVWEPMVRPALDCLSKEQNGVLVIAFHSQFGAEVVRCQRITWRDLNTARSERIIRIPKIVLSCRHTRKNTY